MANQTRLSDNLTRYHSGQPGIVRKGCALLQGIAVCGRCGRRMTLSYSGVHGEWPVYKCEADKRHRDDPACQQVRALPVDAEVERLVLEGFKARVTAYIERTQSRREAPWTRSARIAGVSI